MPYLIRLIFEKRKKLKQTCTVVYAFGGDDWYYIFNADEDGKCTASVTSQDRPLKELCMLNRSDPSNKNNFLIIDPGTLGTKNINPTSINVIGRVIMCPSFNEKYWNGNDFLKDYLGQRPGGVFFYHPHWTLEELLLARVSLNQNTQSGVTVAQLRERFRIFGPVPRLLFIKSERVADLVDAQDKSLNSLENSDIDLICGITGTPQQLFKSRGTQPSSYVILVKSEAASKFRRMSIDIVSEHVRDKIAHQFRKHLWSPMIQCGTNKSVLGSLFEPIVQRYMMQTRVYERSVAVSFKQRGNIERNRVVEPFKLTGCNNMVFVVDPAKRVKIGCEKTLYHSTNHQYPLIDMIFKIGKRYYAVQATVSKNHDASRDKIEALAKRLSLKDDEELHIFYAVPLEIMPKFNTDPVNPTIHLKGALQKQVKVWIIGIAGPRSESQKTAAASDAEVDYPFYEFVRQVVSAAGLGNPNQL